MKKAQVNWKAFAADVKISGRITRPIHLKEEFGFGQSTTMALWQGKSVGLIPYLVVCSRYNLRPTDYLSEVLSDGC